MTKVRKCALTLGTLFMTAGLAFGSPVHWPKLHHKAKQDQSAETAKTAKTTKTKKSHHLFHHGKQSQKPADSNSK